MDFLTTIMVLCAAVLHATWNALVKGGRDPLYDAAGMSVAWLVLCIVGIPFFPAPDLAVWPYVLVSLVVHTGYLYFLSRSYSIGDFSAVYPVMRGLPPVLVSVAGMFLAGEVLPLAGGLGVVAVSCGILVLEIGKKGRDLCVLDEQSVAQREPAALVIDTDDDGHTGDFRGRPHGR